MPTDHAYWGDLHTHLEDILRRRIIEGRRAEIAADIREARRELQKGRCQPATVAELLPELKTG